MGEGAVEWQVFRGCNNGGVVAAEVQAVNSDTSNTGLSQGSHFNLCPGGCRNQCALILQTSAWLRVQKHFLGQIRPFCTSSRQGNTHTHADTHKYTEHAKVCIKISGKSLNWKNHSPQDEGSGSNDFKTSLEIISVHCFFLFFFPFLQESLMILTLHPQSPTDSNLL